MSKKKSPGTIAQNRKARHTYSLEDHFEAGLALQGWEVRSAREGKVQLVDSHIIIRKGEAWLLNALITPLQTASTHIHPDPTRTRKLLMHRREINRLMGKVEQQGYTIVATAMYWKGPHIKIDIALAKGKKLYDKRATEKSRDWQRQKARVMKNL